MDPNEYHHTDPNGSTTDIDFDTNADIGAELYTIAYGHNADDTEREKPDASSRDTDAAITKQRRAKLEGRADLDTERRYTHYLDINGNTWCVGHIVKYAERAE